MIINIHGTVYIYIYVCRHTYNRIAICYIIDTHLYVLDIEIHFHLIGRKVSATILPLMRQSLEVYFSFNALCIRNRKKIITKELLNKNAKILVLVQLL